MEVSRQSPESEDPATLKGAAARTHALMVATASKMMRDGQSPSISEVAEAAGVSRATAYRYFPTVADMVRAVVTEALGPILDWQDDAPKGLPRIDSLYRTAFPRLFEHEATFRAALRQSLETKEALPSFGRGHRRELLTRAVAGSGLAPEKNARLVKALSLTFGVEAMVVLKDICGLDDAEAEEVALWAARALYSAAVQED